MDTKELLVLSLSALIFGMVLGAYLGTVLYRLKIGTPYITANCYCPDCKHPLRLWEQIPVIGYLLVGGRCRYCKKKISPAYPLRELGVGLYYLISLLTLHAHKNVMIILWIMLPAVMFSSLHFKYKVKTAKAFLNTMTFALPYILLIYILCM